MNTKKIQQEPNAEPVSADRFEQLREFRSAKASLPSLFIQYSLTLTAGVLLAQLVNSSSFLAGVPRVILLTLFIMLGLLSLGYMVKNSKPISARIDNV